MFLDNRLNQEKVASNLNKVIITAEIVYTKLYSLNSNKAHGDDGMGSLMLKELANELKGVLTIIYNRSLSESKIPNDWKIANVTPIFKKGKKCDAGNYQPVSLTSHVCKILESIIKDSITNHINVNNLLNESQHGFISKLSCLTNLLQFIQTVTDYVNQGYPVDVIFLDFQKAFDKVPHGRLLLKVKAMGIGNWKSSGKLD